MLSKAPANILHENLARQWQTIWIWTQAAKLRSNHPTTPGSQFWGVHGSVWNCPHCVGLSSLIHMWTSETSLTTACSLLPNCSCSLFPCLNSISTVYNSSQILFLTVITHRLLPKTFSNAACSNKKTTYETPSNYSPRQQTQQNSQKQLIYHNFTRRFCT